MQWGMSSINSSGDSGQIRIWFPIAFASSCYTAVALELITGSHAMYGALWKYPTTTYFDFRRDGDAVRIPWIAVGK